MGEQIHILPLAYLFGIHLGFGLVAVWLTMWADWWVRAAVVVLRYHRLRWAEIRL